MYVDIWLIADSMDKILNPVPKYVHISLDIKRGLVAKECKIGYCIISIKNTLTYLRRRFSIKIDVSLLYAICTVDIGPIHVSYCSYADDNFFSLNLNKYPSKTSKSLYILDAIIGV
jgi:hypothetical protein